jgi:hypothetical protein
MEQDFEISSNDYTNINTALKTELPHLMMLVTRFMDPLFQSFFYMQLNIYYLILEKMQSFAEGKYNISLGFAEISADYEERKSDAQERVENMNIVKKIISVCMSNIRFALGTLRFSCLQLQLDSSKPSAQRRIQRRPVLPSVPHPHAQPLRLRSLLLPLLLLTPNPQLKPIPNRLHHRLTHRLRSRPNLPWWSSLPCHPGQCWGRSPL